MKKTTYQKPTMQVVRLHTESLLGSGSVTGIISDDVTFDGDGLDAEDELR